MLPRLPPPAVNPLCLSYYRTDRAFSRAMQRAGIVT